MVETVGYVWVLPSRSHCYNTFQQPCNSVIIGSSLSVYYYRRPSKSLISFSCQKKIQAQPYFVLYICFSFILLIQFPLLWVRKVRVSAWLQMSFLVAALYFAVSNHSPRKLFTWLISMDKDKSPHLFSLFLVGGRESFSVLWMAIMMDSGVMWPAQDSRVCLWSRLGRWCWGWWRWGGNGWAEKFAVGLVGSWRVFERPLLVWFGPQLLL